MIEFILFGNMCSGKTTIGQILRNERDCTVISARDVIETNLSKASEEVKELRKKGYLLPDNLIIEWVLNTLNQKLSEGKKVILDGFPRTKTQAECLIKNYNQLGKIIHLDFDIPTLMKRLENRILCDGCGMPYSKLFKDFKNECVYCNNTIFSPRLTDKPEYFTVKTSQFSSESTKVLSVFKSKQLEFITLENYRKFDDLKQDLLKLTA